MTVTTTRTVAARCLFTNKKIIFEEKEKVEEIQAFDSTFLYSSYNSLCDVVKM